MTSETALHRKLAAAVELTETDVASINELLLHRVGAVPGATLISDGQIDHDVFVLLAGWAYCARIFEDGRRQISRLFLPGDFIGLTSSLLGISELTVTTLTEVRVAKIDAKRLMATLQDAPRLWLAIQWSDARDRRITEELVASIGRRSAYQRLAHILVELYLRLQLIGEATDDSYVLPLTQEHLADLLGLTSIHINRVLHRLKDDGVLAQEARTIRLLSRERLMRAADFDQRYLAHQRLLPGDRIKQQQIQQFASAFRLKGDS